MTRHASAVRKIITFTFKDNDFIAYKGDDGEWVAEAVSPVSKTLVEEAERFWIISQIRDVDGF